MRFIFLPPASVATSLSLASERQVGTHFEGVPFFGQKSDFSGSKIRYSGSKRSNSDSVFMAPSREGIPQLRPDFPETSHLMKMLRNVRAERPRWPHEDESFMGMHQMRPTASSLMVQPGTGSKTDANASKWERAIPVNVGPILQYPPRAGQVVPYGYQPVSNRFKDANVGSSVISQSAADEGSRTGIKGSGILSSVNVMAEPSSSKHKSLNSNTEPGSSTPLQRQGPTSASRQTTIFYGGQAHVFDDVHPNKADVIMALAGSNGGSWSTSFSPNSAVKPSVGGEAIPVSGENDTIMAAKTALSSKDNLGRLYSPGNSSHGLGSNDRMLMLSVPPSSVLKKTRSHRNHHKEWVEIAGALKNVLAIAAGIVEGLNLGNNSMAALVAQGCSEIRWLSTKMGAKSTTISGLSGTGDIMLTCFVSLSRNRTVGVRLGSGERLDDILCSMNQVAEGVSTAGAVIALAQKYNVKMPVLTAVARIIDNELTPQKAVFELMNLPQVEEV